MAEWRQDLTDDIERSKITLQQNIDVMKNLTKTIKPNGRSGKLKRSKHWKQEIFLKEK